MHRTPLAALLAVACGLAVTTGHAQQFASAPLEGSLTYLVLSATDEKAFDEFDFNASAHIGGLSGDALPDATSNVVYAVLDSGASTHLVSYPNALTLGIIGPALSGSQIPVSGPGGAVDIDVSIPLGLFAHGVQDLGPGGTLTPAALVGQGNFPCGVNTAFNFGNGSTLPTVVGAPLFAYYPVEVKNSDRHSFLMDGETMSTAEVTFYSGPTDPALPTYPHKIPLELVPAAGPVVTFIALPDLVNGGYTFILPAFVGVGSLYQTASANLRLVNGGNNLPVKLVVDTAAQATLISESLAIDLGVNLVTPDFEVEVQGIAGTNLVPGAYLDELRLPTAAGGITWTNVPVVVINVQSPDGGTLDGILGSNLFSDRDFLFNGADTFPYFELSDYRVPPQPMITAIRRDGTNDTIEVDWYAEPAPATLVLESAPEPDAAPGWSMIETGELATIRGTLTATGVTETAVFRLTAPP